MNTNQHCKCFTELHHKYLFFYIEKTTVYPKGVVKVLGGGGCYVMLGMLLFLIRGEGVPRNSHLLLLCLPCIC